MASITRRETRHGVSYKITVCTGTDITGKQNRHFMTWKVPPGMNAKQAEKKAKQVAAEFEREIEYGFQADNNQTFSEYAEYVFEQKRKLGFSPTTLHLYAINLKRVAPYIGNMKVRDIRPPHLSRMYDELRKPMIRENYDFSTPVFDLSKTIQEMGYNRLQFADACGVCYGTIKKLCRGQRVQHGKAVLVAEAIGKPVETLFNVEHSSTGVAPQTIHRIHSMISEVLNFAEKEMIITLNPAKRVQLPRITTPERNYFQPEQVAAILAAADKEPIPFRALVYVFALTGARRGEVCGLKWSNLDWEKKQIKIDSSVMYLPETGKIDGPTKTRNTRVVPLPDEIIPILKKLRLWQMEQRLMWGDQWEDSDYIFTREKGGIRNPNQIAGQFNRFAARHNLPHINPHAFRHTAASIMISEGADIVSVSRILGHASPTTTEQIYAHEIEEAKQGAAECIAGAILGRKQA